MTLNSVTTATFPFALIFFLGSCSSSSNFFATSDDEIRDICYRPSGNVSIATLDNDYTRAVQILKSFPEQCTTEQAKRVLNYDYEYGRALFETDNKPEALKHFDLVLKNNNSNVYYINRSRVYRSLLLAYLEPANHVIHLKDAATLLARNGRENSDLAYYLYNARYDYGDRSPELMKSYLTYLEDITQPEYYTIPIALAQELGQSKIAMVLSKRQQDLTGIKNKAVAQNIPGYGTAAGNASLLVKRDAFYLAEYSRIGMTNQIDYYKNDLQKHQELIKARAEQSVIDAAYAEAEAAEKRQQQQETIASLASLISVVAASQTRPVNHSTQSTGHSASPALSDISAGTSTVPVLQTGNTSGVPSRTSSTDGNSTFKSYPTANECITRDSTSNSIADFWVNSCTTAVTVMWFDNNDCQTGCMTGVKASGREATNKRKPGVSSIFAVCKKPASPFTPDGKGTWKGTREFKCMF